MNDEIRTTQAHPAASALVLAGGDSRRMGRDKALLPMGGKSLIAHIIDQLRPRFDDIVVCTAHEWAYRFPGVLVVSDDKPGLGPLMGLASGLHYTLHDPSFVVACDIPKIDLDFVENLLALADGYDMVLPYAGELSREPLYEPLFAVYRKSIIAPALDVLNGGRRSILGLLDRVRVRFVPFLEGSWYRNINTADDYTRLIAEKK